MDDRDEVLKRRLDQVVGTSYHEGRNVSERVRLGWRKWLLGALFAVGAACVVVMVIERHRLPSEEAVKAVRKPVEVTILPVPATPAPGPTRR